MADSPAPTCRLCGGTRCLTQAGILRVYLLPHAWAIAVILAGIGLAVWRGKGWLLLSLLAWLIPLAMADLRLLLYPYVAVAKAFGRRPNCPKCEPSGSVFRRG